MTQHTPGPWYRDPYAENDIVSGTPEDGASICTMWEDGYKDEAQPRANANLITAAPDLLEALEDLVTLVDFIADEYDLSRMSETKAARAAIAKAKGEDR